MPEERAARLQGLPGWRWGGEKASGSRRGDSPTAKPAVAVATDTLQSAASQARKCEEEDLERKRGAEKAVEAQAAAEAAKAEVRRRRRRRRPKHADEETEGAMGEEEEERENDRERLLPDGRTRDRTWYKRDKIDEYGVPYEKEDSDEDAFSGYHRGTPGGRDEDEDEDEDEKNERAMFEYERMASA